jgi:hypothetical protein
MCRRLHGDAPHYYATQGQSGFSLLALVQKCPANGTGKTQFESAQKATAVCANREIIGFDWGGAGECTAIFPAMVEEIKTKTAGTSPAIDTI